jgi:hypothetical protein
MLDTCRRENPSLCDRMTAEYLEMPGLNLTAEQASRLWNVDLKMCVRVLHELTASGFLRKSGHTYIRVDSGRRAA